MDPGIEKPPIKVMAAASIHVPGAFERDERDAELATLCERDPRLACRAAGCRMSLLTAPEFGYREKIFHLVNLPSEVERLTVGETVH